MLNIITAYPEEASPLVRALSLQREQGMRDFQLYLGNGVQLGVSGAGKHRAGKVAAALASSLDGKPANWFNFGVAGSGTQDVGHFVIAKSVHYGGKKLKDLHNWACLSLPQEKLLTVDRPANQYEPGYVYDMEAAGIIEALTLSRSEDPCIVLKLVSDNPGMPIEAVSVRDVKKLLKDSQDRIVGVINAIFLAAARMDAGHN